MKGAFKSRHEEFSFDLNIMMIGLAEEARRIKEETGPTQISTRRDAIAAARQARIDANYEDDNNGKR